MYTITYCIFSSKYFILNKNGLMAICNNVVSMLLVKTYALYSYYILGIYNLFL